MRSFEYSAAKSWHALERELRTWQERGDVAGFWWRDDDACSAGPRLDRLLALADETGVGVSLAVVPAWLQPSLLGRVKANRHVHVLQHGWAHANHGSPHGLGASELVAPHVWPAIRVELAKGRRLLETAFGPHFLPVVVPPWNRIAGELCPCLPALGFRGLSTFGPAQVVRRTSGFNVCNCHCDPVSWKRGGAFTGTQKALAQVIAHLRAKRQGTADPGEPTGLLTHHVDMDDATWDFVSDLLRTLTQHPATEVFTAREVFCDAR